MEIDFNITVSLEKLSELIECIEDALINATSETGLTTEMKKLRKAENFLE
jgi:lipoate-protein ligase B